MNLDFLLIIQCLFDIFLLFLVFVLYRQLKKLANLPLEETIKELKKLQDFCYRITKSNKGSANKSSIFDFSKEIPMEKRDRKIKDLKEEVYRLASQGLDSSEIAQKLGLQEGEVELLISTLDKRNSKWMSLR